MGKSSKYAWSSKRISGSPFIRGLSPSEALEFAKRVEKHFKKGGSIGYFYISALKAMGRI